LQKNMIPFESFEAAQFNARAFRQIKEQSIVASQELANIYGEPESVNNSGCSSRILLIKYIPALA